MAGKEVKAKEYLEKHRIIELLENLTAHLLYDRPGKILKKHLVDIEERIAKKMFLDSVDMRN
jgi:hypothetical protein